jgi:hypothetical protein
MGERALPEQDGMARVLMDDPGDEFGHVWISDVGQPHREQVDPAAHAIGVTGECGAEPSPEHLFQL